ncbi:MAG TPA: hypothetical protein VFR35_13105, partial [Actinoplanes sp.]|nr:hypothetical protein [Actinoplanes sp.]
MFPQVVDARYGAGAASQRREILRHLRSVLYALVLAPAVWILCGVGLTEDLAGRARDASGGLGILYAVALLVLAGATYATLLLAPISPLGPVLAGLIFLGVSLWSVIAPDAYASVWPSSVTREGFDLSRPGYALGLLLAVPLLCTALNVRRWQRHEPPRPSPVGTPRRGRGTPADAGRTPFASPADITMEIPLSAPPPAPASATRRDLGRAFPTRSNSGPAFAARTDSRPASAARTDSRPASAPRTDSVPAFAEAPTEAVSTEPMPMADSGDAPTIFVVDSAGETTTSTLAVLPADEPTMLTPSDEPTMVTPTPSDEPTMVTPSDEPTVATSSHEPTAAEPDDEPTVAVRTHEPKAEAQASDEPTAVAQPSDEPKAEAQASDEPTAEAQAGDEPTAVAQAGDEPTAVAQPSDDNTVVLHASTEGIAQPAAGAVRSEDAEPVTTARVPGVEESGAVTEPIAQEPGAAYDEPAPREAGLDDEPAAKQPEPAAGEP